MSTPMFRTGRRKISPTFGGFTPALGREFFHGLFLCLCGAVFEVGRSSSMPRKRRGFQGGSGAKVPGGDRSEPTEPAGETAPPNVLGGQPSALLALPKAGNCHDPYRDTVENGSTLGKSGIHDTQFDAKAQNLTPIF